MPRVHHVKKARKDNPVCKAGGSYYWWKFRYGGKRYSLTYPKQSQLTQSPYYANLYDLQDTIADSECSDESEFESLRDQVAESLQEFGQECQDSLDNMPDSLQYSPTGELLQERIDACDSAVSEVEGLDSFDEEEPQEHEYQEECQSCDGEGTVPVDDSDPNGDTEECDECHGSGEVYDENAHTEEQSSWEEREFDHYSGVKDEMSEAVSNCFV
jgi:hypothetical protein